VGQLDYIDSGDMAAARSLGPAVVVERVQLGPSVDRRSRPAGALKFDERGRLDALAFHFELSTAANELMVSTDSGGAGARTHWRNALWMLAEPIAVEPGQALPFRFWREGPDRQPRCRIGTVAPDG
jgi:hypothetical protein